MKVRPSLPRPHDDPGARCDSVSQLGLISPTAAVISVAMHESLIHRSPADQLITISFSPATCTRDIEAQSPRTCTLLLLLTANLCSARSVCVCVYMFMCLFMCVCFYMCVFIFVCVCVCVCVCACVSV